MNFPELYCYLNKLKIQQKNLEKAENDLINYIDTNLGGNFREEHDSLEKLREHELCYICKDIFENLHFLKQIKSNLSENNLENLDLNKLRNDMLKLETKNDNLKREIDFELSELNKLETAVTIEVTNIEMKISEVFKQDKMPYKKTNVTINNADEHHLCEEVKTFLAFLNENGGHEGGWSDEDHIIFLKLFNKIKNKNTLTQSLQKLFPDMTKDHILKHINWYETYSELRNRQKTAIERWRQEKSKKEIPKPQEKQVEKKEIINSEQNQVLKEKVQKWKEKRQQKVEQDMKKQNENFQKVKQTEKQKQLKSKVTKEQVKKWKTEKEAKEQAEKIAKEIAHLREKERRMMIANKLIKEFQNQDNAYISKKINQLKTTDNQLFIKRDKSVPRKPQRLFKPTKQWLAKTAAEEEAENIFEKNFSVKRIQKLGTPAWRTVS